MILPIRKIRRPRLTMGQSLASIAVASLPIAILRGVAQEDGSTGEIVFLVLFSLFLVSVFELLFWSAIVGAFPSLRRSLGVPTWFHIELESDPAGIDWVGDPPTEHPIETGEEIHWVE